MGVHRRSVAALLVVVALVLSGCRPVGGQAEVRNESGRDGLVLVTVDGDGRDRISKPFVDVTHIDTQYTDREVQCTEARDGRFEVRDPGGEVLARNDYAARPVCDGDVIVLGEDMTLAWE